MAEKDDKNNEEEEIEYTIVEDEPEEQKAGAKEGDDEGTGEGEGEEESEEEGEGEDKETRLGGGREDDEEDDKKSRRRDENKTRRQRQKEARARTDRELGFLRTRNEELERRFSSFEQETDARVTGSEIANIDTAISKGKSDLQLANQVIQQSMEQKDGKNLTEALDHRDRIRDNLKDLTEAKEYLASADRRGDEAPAQQPMDPRHVAHAQSFMIDHDWWDPRAGDDDSKKVLTIDRSLVQEGYDPKTKDYWDELRERVQEAIPTRFDSRAGSREDDEKGGDNGKSSRKQPRGPAFRTGGRERPLKKNEVYISAERKEAMIEAGVWEDPVLRNQYLKSYATYDAEAQEGA